MHIRMYVCMHAFVCVCVSSSDRNSERIGKFHNANASYSCLVDALLYPFIYSLEFRISLQKESKKAKKDAASNSSTDKPKRKPRAKKRALTVSENEAAVTTASTPLAEPLEPAVHDNLMDLLAVRARRHTQTHAHGGSTERSRHGRQMGARKWTHWALRSHVYSFAFAACVVWGGGRRCLCEFKSLSGMIY